MGERLKQCDADYVGEGLGEGLSERTQAAVKPLLKAIEAVSEQIRVYDKRIHEIAKRYPHIELLTQVYGVGTLIALTFVLTLEDAERFAHSRDVGPFLGLQPKQRDSGNHQPQLGISQAGDRLLRSLLVQASVGHRGGLRSAVQPQTAGGGRAGGVKGLERDCFLLVM
jgi:transposase